jgi:hypothetical protein
MTAPWTVNCTYAVVAVIRHLVICWKEKLCHRHQSQAAGRCAEQVLGSMHSTPTTPTVVHRRVLSMHPTHCQQSNMVANTLSQPAGDFFCSFFSPQQPADDYIAACSSPGEEADKLSLCAQTVSAPGHHLLFRCLRLRCKIPPFWSTWLQVSSALSCQPSFDGQFSTLFTAWTTQASGCPDGSLSASSCGPA